jgi:hypothetical protein
LAEFRRMPVNRYWRFANATRLGIFPIRFYFIEVDGHGLFPSLASAF